MESKQLQTFLTEAETQLFQYRLESGGEPTIMHCVSDLKRHSSFSLNHMILTPSHHNLMLQVQKMSSEILASGMVECFARMSCRHTVKGIAIWLGYCLKFNHGRRKGIILSPIDDSLL